MSDAPAPPSAGPEAGLLGLVIIGLAVFTRSAPAAARVRYPACWRHRWLHRPGLRWEYATDGRVVLDGVSAEFAAGWEAARGVRDGHAGPGAAPDPGRG